MSGAEPPIDAALARRLIAGQFPHWAHLPVTPVDRDGWDNRSFRLGDTMKLRLPAAERYASQPETEHRFLPLLAPHLPLSVPSPLGLGVPAHGYPWHWSVQDWIAGDTASCDRIDGMERFARDLAFFLGDLQRIDARDGPPAGPPNFFRGGDLAVYGAQTRATIARLAGRIDATLATAVWDAALAAPRTTQPVWVHGDIAVGNLLVRDGRLAAVIDFGNTAVGDPACDLVIAWTFFPRAARDSFHQEIATDPAIWARARGWALWKALVTLDGDGNPDPAETTPLAIVETVLAEHAALT